TLSYETRPTPWFCTDPNYTPQSDVTNTLPSCRPGYVIDIEDVVYESTVDDTCSGVTRCSLHNKNTLTFACNKKRSCQVQIKDFRYHINQTCGSTVRFYTKYKCVPVIYDQKDYLCDSSFRRPDINLACDRDYRLYIAYAVLGITEKKSSSACKKEQWYCNQYVHHTYSQLCATSANKDSCIIRYGDRPLLRDCAYGTYSNFSLVDYSCIPSENIFDQLPRLDICSNDSALIQIERGLLHSPQYPQSIGKYLSCKKELHIQRDARFRLFVLQKQIEYYHEFNIRLLNEEKAQGGAKRSILANELLDVNVTNEIVQFELKTNHNGGGHFILYFQVDSRISEYAPYSLEAERRPDDHNNGSKQKNRGKRDFGVLVGIVAGVILVLLILIVVIAAILVSKRRRKRHLKYLHSDDDHDHDHQHLNSSSPITNNHLRPLHIEHPHLQEPYAPRPTSTSSASSSVIIHHVIDNTDRESLLKPSPINHFTQSEREQADNFYEEIKEQQQQAALALAAIHKDKDGTVGEQHYLEPKSFAQKKKFFEQETKKHGNKVLFSPKSPPPPPIRAVTSNGGQDDRHRESDQQLFDKKAAPLATPETGKKHQRSRVQSTAISDAPMASTETLDVHPSSTNLTLSPTSNNPLQRPTIPPPKIPPPRMDMVPQPSAPPLHLMNPEQQQEMFRAHERLRLRNQLNT
ncbi:unnamed protein product, partial [Didymodactylos carnosus]